MSDFTAGMTPADRTATEPRPCVEKGCDEPAGTPWTPYWCAKHDRERMDRISANLDAMAEQMGATDD